MNWKIKLELWCLRLIVLAIGCVLVHSIVTGYWLH